MRKLVSMIVALTFALSTVTAHPVLARGDRDRDRDHGDVIPCAGDVLVVEEVDPDTGAVISATLGKYSAERADDTITVRYRGDVILVLDMAAYGDNDGNVRTLVELTKTLAELCAAEPKERRILAELAATSVLPLLGVSNLQGGGGGYGGAFVLILVLFILLVIIGAGFGLGYGG